MQTGELIREQRKLKGLTQKQLAEAIEVSEPSIRLYELSKRTPSEEIIKKIAEALGISPSALRSYEVSNVREALEMLFRLEEEYGLEPFADDGAHGLSVNHKAPKAPKISMAIETWAEMRRQLESGEITEAEYSAWKASFKG
jgi:transcriptional regulator with XRE-family HTH domain